ncbi:MAG: VanZ family protein [Proteobacteria bacterium]|nr:VanZ family protein [Pseudomonadota bacterium]
MIAKVCMATYAVLIGYFSLLPADELELTIDVWDKAVHVSAYGVFATLAWWSFREGKPFYFTALFIVAYGIVLEFAQQYSPGRQLSGLDMVANMIGVLLVVGVRQIIVRFRAR